MGHALIALVLTALLVPAAAGACTAVAVHVWDHPGFVRIDVTFVHGTFSASNVEATDPQPYDGAATVAVSRQGIRTQAPPVRAAGTTVRVRPAGANRITVAIGAIRGRFKYLSHGVQSGSTLIIDLWNSAPPPPAAEIVRWPGGCLTLDGPRVQAGAVTTAGRERNLSEHQFSAVLRGRDGAPLAQRTVHATRGRWSATLRYRSSRWQLGTSEAADFSARDGSLVCLVQRRVTLPAAGPAASGVYVTNYRARSVSQYDVGLDGALRPKSPASVRVGSGPLGIAGSPDATSV